MESTKEFSVAQMTKHNMTCCLGAYNWCFTLRFRGFQKGGICHDSVDGSFEIREINSPVEGKVVYPIIYDGFEINPRWFSRWISEPSRVGLAHIKLQLHPSMANHLANPCQPGNKALWVTCFRSGASGHRGCWTESTCAQMIFTKCQRDDLGIHFACNHL